MITSVGEVISFEYEVGLGEVVVNGGGATYPFHCSAISTGTRRIDVGQAVAFTVGPGGPGRWEALIVTPLDG